MDVMLSLLSMFVDLLQYYLLLDEVIFDSADVLELVSFKGTFIPPPVIFPSVVAVSCAKIFGVPRNIPNGVIRKRRTTTIDENTIANF